MAEAEHRAQRFMAAGLWTKDDVRTRLAERRAAGVPATGSWDEAALQRAIDTYVRQTPDSLLAANKAYNEGRITEAQRLVIAAQAENTMATQHAAQSAAIAGALNSAQIASANSAALSQQSWNNFNARLQQSQANFNATQPRTIQLTPTYGGGYSGTIR
jgi:hypothetical protein